MLFMAYAYFIFQQQSRAEEALLIWPGCCTGTWADFMSARARPAALSPLNKRPAQINTTQFITLFRKPPTSALMLNTTYQISEGPTRGLLYEKLLLSPVDVYGQ